MTSFLCWAKDGRRTPLTITGSRCRIAKYQPRFSTRSASKLAIRNVGKPSTSPLRCGSLNEIQIVQQYGFCADCQAAGRLATDRMRYVDLPQRLRRSLMAL